LQERGITRDTFWIALDNGSRTTPADFNNGLVHERSHHQKNKFGADEYAIRQEIRDSKLPNDLQ